LSHCSFNNLIDGVGYNYQHLAVVMKSIILVYLYKKLYPTPHAFASRLSGIAFPVTAYRESLTIEDTL
jgi:hypothetical protein